jgi:hypothetical protein
MLKECTHKEFSALQNLLYRNYPYFEKIVEEIFDHSSNGRSPYYKEKILRKPDGCLVGLHDCQGRYWVTNAKEIIE